VKWWAQEHDLTKDKLLGKDDEQVAQAIRDAAAYDPRVSAADLQIEVDSGAVVLSGSVSSISARVAAEDLAFHTVGVRSVVNRLAILPSRPISDGALKKAVRSALLGNPYTARFALEVEVSAGAVKLGGEVNTAFERATATSVASSIEGVRDIDNLIRVKVGEIPYVHNPYYGPYAPYSETRYYAPITSTRSDSQIAAEIRREIAWSPFVDAEQVHVRVEGGKAVLTGTVDSARERIAATENAYEGGALRVENRLNLTLGE
jgi:osmotically-inducible protein OsmY